jgi:hypothetical protein
MIFPAGRGSRCGLGFFVEGVMKRILLETLLTAGFFLFAGGNAFAQRHPGWPTGPLNGGTANTEQAPAVRSEVRANQPEIRNDRPLEHPFYSNDRGRDNDWRYKYNDNRWWYWTPGNVWSYWNDGRWQDYADAGAVPYTTNYRGPAAPVGWYWNDSQKRYYWFDGTNLTAAQQ